MRFTGALADTRGSRGPGRRWQDLELKWKKQCPELGSRKTKYGVHCIGVFSRDECRCLCELSSVVEQL